MTYLLIFILIGAATHRLTRVIVEDRVLDTPRSAIQNRLEQRWARKHKVDWDTVIQSDTWFSPGAYLLSCMWCMSIWVGGAVTLGVDLIVGIPVPVLVWFAASTATGLLESIVSDDKHSDDTGDD